MNGLMARCLAGVACLLVVAASLGIGTSAAVAAGVAGQSQYAVKARFPSAGASRGPSRPMAEVAGCM